MSMEVRVKQIDMSVLNDNFLVELRYPKKECVDVVIKRFKDAQDYIEAGWLVHPLLNHWHFNDGSMVLPDGLVVEVTQRDGDVFKGFTLGNEVLVSSHGGNIVDHLSLEHEKYTFWNDGDVIAVKIIGLQEGYEHSGMEVVSE